MTNKLKEAIEWLKEIRDLFMPKTRNAIDTVVKALEKPTYTVEDMESFAEWTAIMQWIYDPTDKCWFQKHSTETNTTAKLRELWEIETGRKEEADISVKQKCPECGDESYNSDGNYCLNSDCRLFFI